ncbi:MAG: type I-E CRISPR-associated protein Cas6/Cse3/CasE [Flaviflexus sp.]|nr:type I-E CRISPR-associated protein Cas6/Cse3/CasE [Flaviflexus sp.]
MPGLRRWGRGKSSQNTFVSPGDRHRSVMSLFGEFPDQPRAHAKILFRYEQADGIPPSFLVQSAVEPLAEKLPGGAKVKRFEHPDLAEGQPIVFRLAVNAIVRHSDGTVTPVPFDGEETAEATMSEWLAKKLSPALVELSLLNHRRELLRDYVEKSGHDKRARRVIQVDTVDGVARVSNPAKLREMLEDGVGRARSYGCGLLTVKPVG